MDRYYILYFDIFTFTFITQDLYIPILEFNQQYHDSIFFNHYFFTLNASIHTFHTTVFYAFPPPPLPLNAGLSLGNNNAGGVGGVGKGLGGSNEASLLLIVAAFLTMLVRDEEERHPCQRDSKKEARGEENVPSF